MNILFLITKWLTFPGALVRALLEHITCRILGIPVEDNRVLTNDELFGHVEHELAPTARKSFALCFIPAFCSCIITLFLFIPSVLNLFEFKMTGISVIIINILAYWFAVSIICNSYPLIEDVLNMKEKIYGGKNVLLKIIYAPAFAILSGLAFLEKYCITFLGVVVLTVLLALS